MWGATRKRAQPLKGKQFQSTRPVWGATYPSEGAASAEKNFNPRAPCGARLGSLRAASEHRLISIHAPRVGRDYPPEGAASAEKNFDPRAPCGARRRDRPDDDRRRMISIHAPRVGRDRLAWYKADFTLKDFNPRAPCGARPEAKDTLVAAINISIHAPRVGRDGHPRCQSACGGDFNPRAPCGARRCVSRLREASTSFQSTRPVWGATRRLQPAFGGV